MRIYLYAPNTVADKQPNNLGNLHTKYLKMQTLCDTKKDEKKINHLTLIPKRYFSINLLNNYCVATKNRCWLIYLIWISSHSNQCKEIFVNFQRPKLSEKKNAECTIRSNQIAHDFNVNSYTIRISFFLDLQSILIPKPTKSDHVFSAFTTSSSLIIINPCQVRPTQPQQQMKQQKKNPIK